MYCVADPTRSLPCRYPLAWGTLYDRLGEQVTDELVDWLHAGEARYRGSTAVSALRHPGMKWTREMVLALPDDGNRYELFDGMPDIRDA